MPFTIADVEKHKKGLSPKEAEAWVGVANGVYDTCMKDGDDKKCAPMAIMTANSKAGKKAMEPHLLIALTEGDLTEVKLLYPGYFEHDLYGKFEITEKDIDKAIKNWIEKVAVRFDENGSPQLPFSYQHAGHEADPEKAKASGWIKELFKKGEELWGKVEWTPKAQEYIANKEFQYQSPEFTDNWDDESGEAHGFTLTGATLTNYPHLKKNQLAIALTDKDTIIFDAANINDLPDGSEANGKDGTKPRSLNELPGNGTKKANAKEAENSKQSNKNIRNKIMDEKQLREILNLQEGDILDAVKKLMQEKVDSDAKIKELTEQVNAKENEKKELMESNKDNVILSKENYKELMDGAKAGLDVSKKMERMEAEKLVDEYVAKGVVLPAQKEKTINLYLMDKENMGDWLKNAKPVIEFKEHGSSNDTETKSANEQILEGAQKLAKEKGISFEIALKEFSKNNKELIEQRKTEQE